MPACRRCQSTDSDRRAPRRLIRGGHPHSPTIPFAPRGPPGVVSRRRTSPRSVHVRPYSAPAHDACPRSLMSATDAHSGSGAVGLTAVAAVDATDGDVTNADVRATTLDHAQAGSGVRGQSRRTGYEHLAPLFVEYAALPEEHPHRER